jgi:DNA segregation ATPase FtsK/SpoIIIE, S-DNA-T family
MAKRGRKPKKSTSQKVSNEVIKSTLALFLILFGVVSLIALFGGTGGQPEYSARITDFFSSKFGASQIFIPVITIYTGVYFLGVVKSSFLNNRVLFGLIVMWVSFAGMMGDNAGSFGLNLQGKLAQSITTAGSIFSYFIGFVFSVLVVINMGLKNFIDHLGGLINSILQTFKEILNVKGSTDAEDATEEVLALPGGSEEDTYATNTAFDDTNEYISPSNMDEKLMKSKFEVLKPPVEPVIDGKKSYLEDDDKETLSTPKDKSKLPFSNKLWEYPPISLLNDMPDRAADAGNVQERAKIIEDTLKAFGVNAKIANVHIGPAVTQYALDLAVGTKASRVQSISTDLALRLKSPSGSVRVVAPIPGTNLVGIEVPNFSSASVSLKTVLNSDEYKKHKSKLKVAVGKDVLGKVLVQDISRWPHALVAGSTGSGKSVMLNAIIASLLYNCSPQELRLIMIDPKFVELSQYNGIPHLLTPVVTEVEQKAVSAFAWAVSEMESRYKTFASVGARNLESYNQLSGFQAMPYIVIIVDELADMMMVAASEVEKYITRLAQKSRATGIHLILATQRPSVNVLTGTIKANIPTRIAFKVTSNTDSRVILDQGGAETLIGRGDMLFIPPDDSKPQRVQGIFVHDRELKAIVDFFKKGNYELDYHEDILERKVGSSKDSGHDGFDLEDSKFIEALEIVVNEGKASASHLQRRLSLGYTRAARIIDEMEKQGIIGQARGSKPREVLIASVDEFMEKMKNK